MSLYDDQRKLVLTALNFNPDINVNNVLPKTAFWLGNSNDLSKLQIHQAVRAFCLTLNFTSGNSEDRDLYLLNEMYLTHNEARAKINFILQEYKHSDSKNSLN